MAVHTVVFPFDLFGNSGTGDGARLLADLIREILDDTELEVRPTRQDALRQQIAIAEHALDTVEDIANWRSTGREAIQEALREQGFVLWLAGNHLGVLPVYEELGPDTLVIQLDAHLDCYNLHDTSDELSNGNFLLACEESRPKIVNVGHRDLFLTPSEIKPIFKEAFSVAEWESGQKSILKRAAKAQRIWIDLDVDVFDPSVCPAVHDASPCGVTGNQVVALLEELWSDKVIGMSISEFDPGRDEKDRSLRLLGWLVEWVLLKHCEGKKTSRRKTPPADAE